MAPKRHRGESSRSTPPYDKNRFVSYDSAKFYEDHVDTKKLIPERGLDPGILDGQLHRMVCEYWGSLTDQPEPAAISIVKEFYANAKAIKHNDVMVRGKKVSFSPKTINDYYGLPQLEEEDEYVAMVTGPVNYETILRGLCQPEAVWKYSDGEPSKFNYTYLSRFGKAWYYFICAKLMPTTHVTYVIKERAVLLYCIVNEKKFDRGQVINSSIKYAIKGKPIRGLPHPSLICGLCKAAGVVWDENEPTQVPQVPIDSKIIKNLKQWMGAQPEQRGAGFLLNEPYSPNIDELVGAEPEQEEASSSSTINSLVEEVRQLRRDSRRQARRNDQIAQAMGSMMQYHAAFSTTLAEAFNRLEMNAGREPLLFPHPPSMPVLPPDSPEEEPEGNAQ